MNITAGHIAFIAYELIGPENQTIYAEEMFPYIHGETQLLNGMNNALQGKTVGDSIDVTMSASDAFGEEILFEPFKIRKEDIGPSFEQLRPGTSVISQVDGTQLYVQKVTPEFALLSANHPLAGKEIRFKAHIKEIRAASVDEMTLGYPLSLDGINTSSGSCSCC